jgi:pimeloyl-ACP methyl ester carboxylesterase
MFKRILFITAFTSISFNAYTQDAVVLLHGIARSSASMNKIEHFMTQNGYSVLNLNYPSTEQPLESLVEHIHPNISRHAKAHRQIHFITHSMGGLLARAYLHKYKPENLGRVVMLSPPNKGSEIADLLQKNFLYQQFYGSAGQQLITDQSTFEDILGEVDYELGIIAGTQSIAPISSLLIPHDDDGKVSLQRMRVKGMDDYKEISSTHTFIMKNKKAKNLALRFIQTGRF